MLFFGFHSDATISFVREPLDVCILKKPFFGELIDFALFSLSQPLPVCEAFDGLTVGGAPIKFSIVKLPVADVKSEEWKSHEIDHHQLKHCIFLGYGESDEGTSFCLCY
uniref:Peptidase S1 domain-containing protein n=1 Tax=Ascaris lumbricoides TaxID=6252 RepID=A0A0M3IXQ3_ASCLU